MYRILNQADSLTQTRGMSNSRPFVQVPFGPSPKPFLYLHNDVQRGTQASTGIAAGCIYSAPRCLLRRRVLSTQSFLPSEKTAAPTATLK